VHEHGIKTVNQQIGKMVMTKYGLTPDIGRNNDPKSTLIATSHQEFE
jgi:hypothetical protein